MEVRSGEVKSSAFEGLLAEIYEEEIFLSKKEEHDNFFRNKALWEKRINIQVFEVFDGSRLVAHAIVQLTNKHIYIGFVEAKNSPSAADLLIGEIKKYLQEHATPETKIFLPVNQSIWHNYRFKTEGKGLPVFDVKNPSYYPDLFKKYFKSKQVFETYESRGLKYEEEKKFDYKITPLKSTTADLKKAYLFLVEAFGDEHEPPSFEEFAGTLLPIRNLLDPNYILFAEYNNEVIGFISSFLINDNYYLKTLGVKKEFRQNKIGKYLYATTAKKAKASGAEKEYYLYIRQDRLIYRIIKHKRKTAARYVLYWTLWKHF